MRLLSNVLNNYLSTKNQHDGRSVKNDSADQESLLTGLPNFFRSLLSKLGRTPEFLIEGSIGNGNLANVPWVAIFNKSVTESAQKGYYIVLLFSQDMHSCYISLNQGVTEIRNHYGQQIARAKMREAANLAIQFFVPDPFATLGPIDLAASGHLGQGYEQGAIESYRYELNTLPTEVDFAHNFDVLLGHYDRLVAVVGASLQAFVPINEGEFQSVALGKAVSLANTGRFYTQPQIPVRAPSKSVTAVNRYERKVEVAAFAISRANFKCEIDSMHETFVSRARNQPYVEAHHLIPMSAQGTFEFSLDVPANVVALCATCHKLLHHGRSIDKKLHLGQLLLERRTWLAQMAIDIEQPTLFSYYNSEFIDLD